MLKSEREDYDEPDIDPSKFEKRKEVWDEFEDDTELNESLSEEAEAEDPWKLFGNDNLPNEDEWDEENSGEGSKY